jgi:hypothetical protein
MYYSENRYTASVPGAFLQLDYQYFYLWQQYYNKRPLDCNAKIVLGASRLPKYCINFLTFYYFVMHYTKLHRIHKNLGNCGTRQPNAM